MSLKPYPQYKRSELTWVELIPDHWSLVRNKTLFMTRKEVVGEKSGEYDLLSLTLNGVIKRDLINPKGKFPAEFNTYQVVKEKDFVFCFFDVDETPRTIGISPHNGMITGAYTVLKPLVSNNKFLFYYYLHLDNIKALKPIYTGLRKVIPEDRFLRTKTPIPSLAEQIQIVNYLDLKTSQINKFIKAKKRQIELLKEQKQVIINEAVTGKIDVRTGKPYPKYKDSGVEWLGRVPEEWEVLFIRQITKYVKTGSTPKNSSEKHFDDYGFNWFTPGDFSETLFLTGSTRKLSQLGCTEVTVFPKGSVFMIGIGATIGKASICKMEAACNQQISILMPKDILLNVYLVYILRLLKPYILDCGKFTTLPILNQDDTKKLKVPLPLLNTQEGIVNYLNGRLLNIDRLILNIEEEIIYIIEYRTRLIADVVTGKVDVRDIKIPEYDNENELVDIEDEIEEALEEATVDNDL